MFATLYVPNFYLQAALRNDPVDLPPSSSHPVALIDERAKKPVIVQLNASAESAGVRSGMTPSQALARCLTLLIKPRSGTQEKSAQEILLEQAFTLTPYVEATGPGLCTAQFTDTRNLVEKVSRAVARLAACQLVAQAGLGPAPDTSFLAAQLARPVLQIDDPKKFLAPLPIEILTLGLDIF
jgi:nucleotidyltransferase/DNA polymerase involved in DNA repair